MRGHRRPHDDRAEPVVEDPVVRQYRFLLRTAPADALEAAHVEAFTRAPQAQCEAVLAAVQRGLAVGARTRAEDSTKLSHLVVSGERREPGAFLHACDPGVLRLLSQQVVHSEAVFGLFGSYAAWDGADPEPEDDSAWRDAGFNPDSGRWSLDRPMARDNSGIVSAAGGADGGGGGGGN